MTIAFKACDELIDNGNGNGIDGIKIFRLNFNPFTIFFVLLTASFYILAGLLPLITSNYLAFRAVNKKAVLTLLLRPW